MKRHLLVGFTLAALWAQAADLTAQAIHPQWSPDGEWIVWYQRVENRALIHRARPDGRDHSVLIDDDGWYANPSFVPGSDRLAMASAASGMMGAWNLFTIDIVTGERCQITDTPAREMHASASPDGTRIAFIRMADGASDVFIADMDGTERRLTLSPSNQFHPKWSPDGRSLAFDSSVGDDQWLDVLDLDSGRTVRIEGIIGRASTPAWMDGFRLVFSRPDGEGRSNLFMIGRDGSGLTRLTDLDGATGAPFVSPTGDRVAFHSSHQGEYHIYVMALATGDIQRISP